MNKSSIAAKTMLYFNEMFLVYLPCDNQIKFQLFLFLCCIKFLYTGGGRKFSLLTQATLTAGRKGELTGNIVERGKQKGEVLEQQRALHVNDNEMHRYSCQTLDCLRHPFHILSVCLFIQQRLAREMFHLLNSLAARALDDSYFPPIRQNQRSFGRRK